MKEIQLLFYRFSNYKKKLTVKQNKKNYMKMNSVLPFSVVKDTLVFHVNHTKSD